MIFPNFFGTIFQDRGGQEVVFDDHKIMLHNMQHDFPNFLTPTISSSSSPSDINKKPPMFTTSGVKIIVMKSKNFYSLTIVCEYSTLIMVSIC